jgi:hypothetical protein
MRTVVMITTVTAMIRTVVTVMNTTTRIANTVDREGLQMKSKPFPVAQTRILVMFGA